MRTAALTHGLIVAGVLGFAFWQGLVRADSHVGDDGWRRTTAGWERVELWAAPKNHEIQGHFQFRPQAREARPRWDVHPGMLALWQLVVVTAAFWICRVGGRNGGAKPNHKGASGSLSEPHTRTTTA